MREARLKDPILLSERAMSRMVAHAQWMLHAVGADGIRLTKSGYLPQSVVAAAMSELDWGLGGLPQQAMRESHAGPLLDYHRHLVEVGLLKTRNGVLLQTVKGRALAGSPRELWWHLAETFARSRRPVISDATTLLLLVIATREFESREAYDEALAFGLHMLGWRNSDDSPISGNEAVGVVIEKLRILGRMGVFADENGSGHWVEVTAPGAAFARAALRAEVRPLAA
ncbi:MAG: plasmid pRiA4b family protein [Microbacteriaceae bacterium]|nr:plasmid pRiA4b family protein [Microbacteriaceae bacterium]